jgi:riboflavin synthase
MFTGIVEEVGRVRALDLRDADARLWIDADRVLEGTAVGDSIAVDGCCLTVTRLPGAGFEADLMAETLRATALGGLEVGAPVNLERAMSASGRLGGHLVQGHVDAVGEVTAVAEQPGTVWLSIKAPGSVARYLVPKGSVTVAGVSLTVVDVSDDGTFRLGLIPHTLGATTLATLRAGDRVNLEADVVAKYVARLLAGGTPSPYDGIASEETT